MKSINFQNIFTTIQEIVINKGLDIIVALVVLVIGWQLTKYLTRLARKGMEKSETDPSLIGFLTSIISISLKALLIVSVASMIGIETTSFVAVLGAAGLAIGLALQGSLSNFAGGILILSFKPFKVGDLIETQGKVGEVEHIGILNTTFRQFDNKVVISPNGDLANSMITNLTAKPQRRVEIPVGIAYDSDIDKARELILKILKDDDRVQPDPEPLVLVTSLADSAVNLNVRAWAEQENVYEVFWDNIEKVKKAIDRDPEITIPFPQRDVHLYSEKEF